MPPSISASATIWAEACGTAMMPILTPSCRIDSAMSGVALDHDPIDILADPVLVAVEDAGDPEGGRHESAILGDGPAEIAESDQRDLPRLVQPQDPVDLLDQAAGVIALALLPETAEIGEISPDLRAGNADRLSQLIGRDGLGAGLVDQELQRPHIDRQTPDDDVRDLGFVDRASRRDPGLGIAGAGWSYRLHRAADPGGGTRVARTKLCTRSCEISQVSFAEGSGVKTQGADCAYRRYISAF